MRGHQASGEADRGDHRDLLSQHRADRQLEAIPGAGHAQTRSRLDQRRQRRILGEMGGDGKRIGGQVEDAAQPRDDDRQRRQLGKADARPQRVSPRRPDGDDSLPAVELDGSRVTVLLDALDAGNRAEPQKLQHGRPIVGGLIAQQQADRRSRAAADRAGSPRRKVHGARPNKARNVPLNLRMLPKPAANAISVIDRDVSWMSCLASSTRRV